MANDHARTEKPAEWILANPWFWMTLGVASSIVAWLWTLLLGDGAPAGRFVLIGLALLPAAAAITIRMSSPGVAFLEHASLTGFRRLLGAMYALVALSITVVLLLRLFGIEVFWRPGSLILIWLLIAPMSAAAARFCFRSGEGAKSLSEREETAALLVLAALTSLFCCFALYLGANRAQEWESIRLFLGVLAFVALIASPLVVAPPTVRRNTISLAVLLHFGGICTAVLASPPYPWIIGQIWTRVYRPYLEFMYLNNAYHFYAPEPGPASYLWFRLLYEDDDKQIHGEWYKVPEMDDKGRPRSPVALSYQRILALTENASYITSTPPDTEVARSTTGEYKLVPASYFARRVKRSPDYRPLLGEAVPKGVLKVPFHPGLPLTQQYMAPTLPVKQVLETYTRHVCTRKHSEHPEWQIKAVKVYRVVHLIPEHLFLRGWDPRYPTFYRPFYLGDYNPEGKLINPDDSFLYWMLPIFEDGERLRNYALRHAGEQNWVHPIGHDAVGDDQWLPWNEEGEEAR